MSSFLIVGCGDIGRRTGARLRARGHAVRGQVRSAASAAALAAAGIEPLQADLDTAAIDVAPAGVDAVFWFAPPPASGRGDPRLRTWLQRHRPARLVYISTSGVYGDCAGRWIDEDEPLRPRSDRGRRRLDAEQALAEASAAWGLDARILRVPGIYGPGRLPVERLRARAPVIREDECPPTNRIHADDLAEAALAVWERGARGRAYNVADGQPTTMTDYFVRCARLLGLPEPERVSFAEARQRFTPAMLSFVEESKCLRTDRLRDETGWRPGYPDLASGLPSCLDAVANG